MSNRLFPSLSPRSPANAGRSGVKNRIREFRTKKGMTQEALAQAAGVRRETIVFLEQGKYNPSLLLARNVAKMLGTGIDELFSFEEK